MSYLIGQNGTTLRKFRGGVGASRLSEPTHTAETPQVAP